jgi:hypothetical protein
MRRNAPSVGSAGLPTRYSLAETLVYAVVTSLAVVTGTMVLLYPAMAVTVVAVSVAACLGTVAAMRLRLTRRSTRRVLMVRVPFTDLKVEV